MEQPSPSPNEPQEHSRRNPVQLTEPAGTVLEIALFHLQPGTPQAAYLEADRAVERTHASQQPGFVSREIGTAEDGQHLVAVHWKDAASADASMATFMQAPATADFMALIQTDTMTMTRYTLKD